MIMDLTNVPVLSFTYFKIDQIPLLDSILSMGIESIKELNIRYALYSYSDYPLFHSCTIYQILYNDIPEYIEPFYNKFVENYGQDTVDMLILKDENDMRRNIKEVIKFAFEKIYHVDEILIEVWDNYAGETPISTPNIIYSVLDENFTIINRTVEGRKNRILINLKSPTYNTTSVNIENK